MSRFYGKTIRRFVAGEEAATAIEYAIMLALLITAVIATIQTLGSAASGSFSNTASKL